MQITAETRRAIRITLVSLAVAAQRVRSPKREDTQRFRILHILQERQHRLEFVDNLGRQSFGAVLQVEPLQTLMDEIPD